MDTQDAARPEALVVVSDSAGYVGTFSTAAEARTAVLEKYPAIPFLLQRFPVAPGPADTVWVVLFRDLDAVAFVSNSKDEAVRVQAVYSSIGLTYDDSIDYWEQSLGVVSKRAADRLDAQARACRAYAGLGEEAALRAMEADDQARLEAIFAPAAESPLARVIRENETITILDAVVPVASLAADEPLQGAQHQPPLQGAQPRADKVFWRDYGASPDDTPQIALDEAPAST